MPRINTDQAIEVLKSFLAELDELKKLFYTEGSSKRTELEGRLLTLIRHAFDDGKDRIDEYNQRGRFIPTSKGRSKTELDIQEEYLADLNIIEFEIKNYLRELELLKSFEK